MSDDNRWERTQALLRARLSPAGMYIAGAVATMPTRARLVVTLQSVRAEQRVREHADAIAQAVQEVYGPRVRVEYVIGDGAADEAIVQRKEPARKKIPLRQMDLFSADLADVNPKDDTVSMEHPMWAITKQADMTTREFVDAHGRKTTLQPSAKGLATIFDKDILIFAISQLMAAKARNETPRRQIRIRSIDLIRATRRSDGAASYRRLRDALDRLRGTQISTEIETNGKRTTSVFGWLSEYEIISDRDGKVHEFAIELPSWVYEAVLGDEVLSISPEYFALQSGLARKMYEIGRKHLGRKSEWRVSLARLREKTGAVSTLYRFRSDARRLIDAAQIPELDISFADDDIVIFRKKT